MLQSCKHNDRDRPDILVGQRPSGFDVVWRPPLRTQVAMDGIQGTAKQAIEIIAQYTSSGGGGGHDR